MAQKYGLQEPRSPSMEQSFAEKLRLTVEVDPTPPPLTIGAESAFSPLQLEIATDHGNSTSSGDCVSDDTSSVGDGRVCEDWSSAASSSSLRPHSGRKKGAKGAKTLCISKSGSIHIGGFEIRKSGLFQKNTPNDLYANQPSVTSTPPKSSGGREKRTGGTPLSLTLDEEPVATNDMASCPSSGGSPGAHGCADETPGQGLHDCLVPLGVLGRGAGGSVWQGIHVPSLRLVAVKTIPVFEEGRRLQMVQELRSLYWNLAPFLPPSSSLAPSPPPPRTTPASPPPFPSAADGPGPIDGTGGPGLVGEPSGQVLIGTGTHRGSPGGAMDAGASRGGGGCPQLVSFYDAYVNPREGTVSIVQEFMDAGSLQDVVDAGGCADEAVLAHMAREVLQGLAYLHARRQIHRDIKPANLLLNHRGEVKISDFGLVRHFDASISRADTFVGTFTYMSPERICGGEYGYSADIWGVGLTLVTCALGRLPYEDAGGYWELVSALKEREPPSLPRSEFSSEFRDFVRQCLNKEPSKRPTARYLLDRHPFLRQTRRAVGQTSPTVSAAAPEIGHTTKVEGKGIGRVEWEEEEAGEEVGAGSTSARRELSDILEAVKSYHRRLWQDMGLHGSSNTHSSNSQGGDPPDVKKGLALMLPNAQMEALKGLAGQLGLPLRVVRADFRQMLYEMIKEQCMEAGAEEGEEAGQAWGQE